MPEIRNRIAIYRKALGLTQTDLAKLVGVTRNYISDLECNKYIPSLRIAYRIAHYLGTTIPYIFTFNEFNDKWRTY